MRILCAIGAAILIAGVMPAAGRADGSSGPAAAAQPTPPGCRCPRLVRRHVHCRARYHARRVRHWPEPYVAALPALSYNVGLPSPWDSDYDRAIVLHLRSLPVSGIFVPDPGYPPMPPVRAVQPYRFPAAGAVYEYDGLTGQYIALSAHDAAGALPPSPPAATAAAR